LKPSATYADLEALPENLVGEIVDGKLYASPRPSPRHAIAAAALEDELGPPFKRGRNGPGGWMILLEPEMHLEGQVLVPDLAGWRLERWKLPDEAFFTIAPDWICEIASPSTALLDRRNKMPHYSRAGEMFAWIVDPSARTLESYRSAGDGTWVLLGTHGDEDKIRAAPFEAIQLDLSLLWGG
jgi:Uma2 family endonuclease